MEAHWYYAVRNQVIGPVGQSELKWLIAQGAIELSTLVRHGEDGRWLEARETEGLVEPIQHVAIVDQTDQAAWFYSRGGRTSGPVSFQKLRRLAATGILRPDDLGWKEGAEGWQPVGQVPGLFEGRVRVIPAGHSQERVPVLAGISRVWKLGIAGLAFLVFVGIGIWALVPTRISGVGRVRAPLQPLTASKTPVGARPDRSGLPGTQLPAQQAGTLTAGQSNAEKVLSDALGAIQAGLLDRARELLDRYIALPEATEKDKARQLRRELLLATSVPDAAELARKLSDQELRSHLRDGAQALAEGLETLELRSFYQNTLMMALRQENTRRQMVPRQAIAQQPELGRPDPDRGPREQRRGAQPEKISPRGSLLGPGRPAVLVPDPGDQGGADQGGGPDEHAVAAGSVEIDRVLMAPADYRGKTLSINGVFKVGTRISEVRDSKGRVVGFSIPVSRNDGRTICTADGKVEGHDLYMILDAPIAQILSRVFTELKLEPTIKPTYRTVLEISVQELPNAHGPDHLLAITSLEILGMCDYLRIARHQYDEAFRVVEVNATGGRIGFGDGSKWVERLGGEEKYVQPIRRKFRELQRRIATDSRQAVFESVYRRELNNVMRAADNLAAIQAMEIARWQRRITP